MSRGRSVWPTRRPTSPCGNVPRRRSRSPHLLDPIPLLPEPLRGNERGTFAHSSVAVRLPDIARRAMAENDLAPAQIEEIKALITEIASGSIAAVGEPEAPDAPAWEGYLRPYLGMGWLDAPWFVVETYFYRRLLAAVGYSRSGRRHLLDPFQRQKWTSLEHSIGLATSLTHLLDHPADMFGAALWANQVDLSLWPAGSGDGAAEARTDAVTGPDRRRRLLIDHTQEALAVLDHRDPIVHIVLDNAGAELVADLALVAALVNIGTRVVIHAKSHPTFVSDATALDVVATLRRLEVVGGSVATMARTVDAAMNADTVRLIAPDFWVSPLAMWECPPDLAQHFRAADLIVVKGDANYRRLLGDRHWPFDTPFDQIVRPSAPLVALRTLKAEVAAGIPASVVREVAATDSEWMTNGEWGLIQFAPAV